MIAGFVNAAKNLEMWQASAIVRALQLQIPDFVSCWEDAPASVGGDPGVMVPLLYPDARAMPEGVYRCAFVDTPDVAGALGYHSVDNGGKYYARIFVDLLLQRGAWNEEVSACASHEFLELWRNATCLKGVIGPVRKEGSRYQLESCDPVEADRYPFVIERDGRTSAVQVSNFVGPRYFGADSGAILPGAGVDWLGTCPGPFQLAPGGYLLVSKDGLEEPSPVFGETPPAPHVLEYKQLGRRFHGGRRRGK